MVVRSKVNLSLKSIQGVLIIDSEGKRLLGKYYGNLQNNQKFERGLWEKTRKQNNGDVILYEGLIVLYKHVVDLFVYVIGYPDENEVMLFGVLQGFIDACNQLLKNQLEKRSLLESLDVVLLVLDETIDDGIILETDSSLISARVAKANSDPSSLPISDQTLSQVWKQAQEQVAKGWFGK